MRHVFKFSLLILFFAVIGAGYYLFTPSYLQQEIDSYLKAKGFQGSALVIHKDKILFNRSYGFANIEHCISNTSQTVFRIGSITKLFTAVAVLQLQAKGLLNVTDSISKYIPEYPRGDEIKIHHLLTHTSGIPSITRFPNLIEIQRLASTPTRSMDHFRDLPLRFVPGTDCESSDSNYIILGAIIESVTHKTYEKYVTEEILQPLNMSSTYYEYNHYVIPHRASGYQSKDEIFYHAPFIDMSLPHAAGALSTTAEDLYKWDQALKGTTFLSEKQLNLLFTIHSSNETNQLASGYGFRVGPLNRGMEECDPSILGHFATIDGFEAAFIRYLADDLTIILLSNVENTNVRLFHKAIAYFVRSSWRQRA